MKGLKNKRKEFLLDILFIGPALLAFITIVFIPLIMGIFYSFTNWNGLTFTKFVGLKNFITAFHDETFLKAFWFTTKFAFVSVVTINLTGFLLALLVTRKLKTSNFLRAVFYMPNLVGGLILGFVWNFVFVEVFPKIGEILGVSFFNGWLANASTGFWGLVILTTWQLSGYMMVIYIASIQGIPDELIEASQIDGATSWQVLKNIILPLVVPAFTVSLFLTMSNTFKLYDQNLALTQGGPGGSTQMIAMNIYNTAYHYNQNALGQAKAVIFLVVVVVLTLTQVSLSKRKEVQM